jgi:hypothetical protein
MSDLSVQLETPHAGKYTQPTGLYVPTIVLCLLSVHEKSH